MKKEHLDILHQEYLSQTKKTSTISQGVIIGLVLINLVLTKSIPDICAIYFIFEILGYAYLGLRAELTFTNIINIKTSNKIRWIGCGFYYIKVVIVILALLNYMLY